MQDLNYTNIESKQNIVYKHIKQLLDLHSYRQKHQQTVLEGLHLFSAFMGSESIASINAIYICENLLEKTQLQKDNLDLIETIKITQNPQNKVSFNKKIPCYVLSKALWQSITSQPNNSILCILNYPQTLQPEQTQSYTLQILANFFKQTLLTSQSQAIILDDIQDAGNLGTILRTSAACGVKFVLCLGGAHAYSPKVLRAGMGAHAHLQILYWPLDQLQILQQELQNLITQALSSLTKTDAKQQFALLGTSLQGQLYLYSHVLPKHVIWLFGNEGQGLRQSWQRLTQTVKVPQLNIESLNVASCAGLCMYAHAFALLSK